MDIPPYAYHYASEDKTSPAREWDRKYPGSLALKMPKVQFQRVAGQKMVLSAFSLSRHFCQTPQLLKCDECVTHMHGIHRHGMFEEKCSHGAIPNHTRNWTQPLDCSFYKSLKSAWNKVDSCTFIHTTGVAVGHIVLKKYFKRLCLQRYPMLCLGLKLPVHVYIL